MRLGGWQPAECIGDLFVRESLRFPDGPAAEQFGCHARAGNDRPAAVRAETRFGNAPLANLDADAHDIPAGDRADFAHAVRAGEVADVAWIQEMVQNALGVVPVRVAHGSFDGPYAGRTAGQ